MKCNKECEYNGTKYKSIRQCCISEGKNYNTVIKRMMRGLTLKEALEKSEKAVDQYGKEFNSIEEMCKYYGVSKSTYYNRINSGLTKEQALRMGGRCK